MITIIEGCDGAGKSTLIKYWEDFYNDPRNAMSETLTVSHHDAYLGKDGNNITMEYLDDLLTAKTYKRHVIMDRSWISEFVYGPIMRNENRITIPHRRMLERVALTSGAVVVYCHPPFEECKRAYLSRKELEYLPDTSKLKEVWDAFYEIQSKDLFPALPSFGYDWTAGNNRNLVKDFISTVEALRPTKANHGPGIGSFIRGNTLIVGDQTPPLALPFVSFMGPIADMGIVLEMAKVKESELYWINARDDTGEVTPGGNWLKVLRPRKVIALGATALKWCHDNSLRHVHELAPLNLDGNLNRETFLDSLLRTL